MMPILRELDDLLRGRYTRAESLEAGRIELPARRLLLAALVLGVSYGACMGLFGAMRGGGDGWLQLVASIVKVPLLFLLTLAVTFPSLYVSSALADSRLEVGATLRLLLAAIAVDLALLASLGPVVAFFTLSTTSYPFMVLLNVVAFASAGFAGVAVLRKSAAIILAPPRWPIDEPETPEPVAEAPASRGAAVEERPVTIGLGLGFAGETGAAAASIAPPSPSSAPSEPPSSALSSESSSEPSSAPALAPALAPAPAPAPASASAASPGPLSAAAAPAPRRAGRHRAEAGEAGVRRVFAAWLMLLAVVGAQLGWVLRPFIGSPGMEFQWFRSRGSNFFAACLEAVRQLLQ
jgi:hypothetical protein